MCIYNTSTYRYFKGLGYFALCSTCTILGVVFHTLFFFITPISQPSCVSVQGVLQLDHYLHAQPTQVRQYPHSTSVGLSTKYAQASSICSGGSSLVGGVSRRRGYHCIGTSAAKIWRHPTLGGTSDLGTCQLRLASAFVHHFRQGR